MREKSVFVRTIAKLDKGTLKRVLKVKDLFAIGYGDLGSSIYYALGITAFFALGATPLALGMAGIVFICTALTYAEMTSIYPESGGSASFTRHAFNDLISFIAGWGLLFDYIITIAISAFSVGPYLAFFYPDLKITEVQIGFTIGIIAILFLVNFFGIRQSTRISWILAGFTLGIQLLIILVGLFTVFDLPSIISHLKINVAGASWSPSWPEFWKGTAMAMVAYTGIESIAQLAAEAKKPAKTVPRAIIYTMFFLIAIYLGISFVALSALSPHELGTTYANDPLAGIASALPFGKGWLSVIVSLPAAAILIVAANAGLLGASRLSFNMGEYYQLPRLFFRLHPKYKTPYLSLGIFALIAIMIIALSQGKLIILADLYNFGAMIGFFFSHLSLIVLRIKRPDLARPFRIWGNIPFMKARIPITAIIGLIATLGVWLLIVFTKPEGRYFGLSWMILGIIMYLGYRRGQKIESVINLNIEKFKLPSMHPVVFKKILVPLRHSDPETVSMACYLAKKHNASITAVHVIEVPYSMPLDLPFPQRVFSAGKMLRESEAIARDANIPIELQIVRSRSIAETVVSLAKTGRYDLVLLADVVTRGSKKTIGSNIQKILSKTPCRILVFKQQK